MKKVFTIALTSLLLFLFSTFKAQNPEILKSFINKNDFVLRSVQKNVIRLSDYSLDDAVKSILKLQFISIKFYESDKELSKRAAYQARLEGISFLQKNSDVPSETFRITEKEKNFFGALEPLTSADENLTEAELKSVREIDAKDPSLFNLFITRLQ